MFAIIKFIFFFGVSFLILSFPISKKPAFYYLHESSSHLIAPLFTKSKSKIKESSNHSKNIFSKLFNNIKPVKKAKTVKIDKIKKQESATLKKVPQKELDSYTDEEQELLKKVLSSQN
ncbi:hypothetical protein N9O57_02025 [bacterium]|nr:hypothetical protein [bacterium]